MTKGVRSNAKVDTITNKDIQDFLRLGCSCKEIAECFDVSPQRVAGIKGNMCSRCKLVCKTNVCPK